MKTYMLLN